MKRIKQDKPKGITAVELSERCFKIAQALWDTDGARLAAVTGEEWNLKQEGQKAEEKLQATLRSLPAATTFLIGCLPRSSVTTRHLLLPSQDPKELRNMVALQVQRQIPFSKGKIVFDYRILEAVTNGRSHLFLVIAEEEVVHNALSLLQKVGTPPQIVSFSSWGLLNWAALHHAPQEGDPFFLFLDVDRWNSHAEIVHHHQLYFSRSFPIGSEALKQADGPASFSREVSHFLGAFKKEFPEASLSFATLGGISEVLPKAKSALSGMLPFPIELLPADSPLMTESLKGVLNQSSMSFSSVLGLVLARSPVLNLLPEAVKQRQRRRSLRRQGSRIAVLALAFFFLFGFSVQGLLQERRRYLEDLQKELRRLDPLVSQTASMEKELEALRDRAAQSQQFLETVRTVYETIPATVSLTFLSLEPDRVSLRGISQEISQVFSFAEALEKSPELEKVEVKNTSQRRLQDREVIDFRIDALLTTKGTAR